MASKKDQSKGLRQPAPSYGNAPASHYQQPYKPDQSQSGGHEASAKGLRQPPPSDGNARGSSYQQPYKPNQTQNGGHKASAKGITKR